MKKGILIALAAVLLIDFSMFATYSKYSEKQSGTGNLVAATWDVSLTGDSSVALTAGLTQTYSLTINNSSEVDIVYDVIIDKIPNDVQVKLDDGSYYNPIDNKITISNAGTLLYGTTTKSHTLTFSAPLGASEVSDKSISINVEFEQKKD